MPSEQVYRGAAPPSIGRGLVASSFQYYLTGDESLRVTVHTLSGAAAIEIAMRVWREDDRVIFIHRETLRTADPGPSTVTRDYGLTAGALLNLRLAKGSGSVFYGLVWVQAQLVRGAGTATEILGTLLQGYIGAANDLGWPGSPIEKQDQVEGFVETQVAALGGVVCLWTVPSGERWQVVGGTWLFTASGIVGNRYPAVHFTDGAGQLMYQSMMATAVAAGQTVRGSFGRGASNAESPVMGVHVLSWPHDVVLNGSCTVATSAGGALAGDSVSGGLLHVRKHVDG